MPKKKILIITHKLKNKIDNKNLYAGNDYLIAELLRKKFQIKIYEYSLLNSLINLNKEIIKFSDSTQPDIILFFDLESKPILKNDTIKYLSESFYLVNLCMDSDLYISNNNFYNQYMDYILTNSPDTFKSSLKKRSQYFDIGTYRSRKKNSKKKYDVVFLGTINKSNRKDYISFLKKKNIKVYDFGPGTSNGVVSPSNYYKIINSAKICLRFSSRNFKKDIPDLRKDPLSINKKSQHIGFLDYLSCGSFLLVEQIKTLNIFKKNNCFKFFKNKEDLLLKIKFFLKNKYERDKISSNGYKIFKNFFQIEILNGLYNNLIAARKIENKNISFNLKNYILFKYNQNNFILSTLAYKNLMSKFRDIFFILRFPYFNFFYVMKLLLKKFFKS